MYWVIHLVCPEALSTNQQQTIWLHLTATSPCSSLDGYLSPSMALQKPIRPVLAGEKDDQINIKWHEHISSRMFVNAWMESEVKQSRTFMFGESPSVALELFAVLFCKWMLPETSWRCFVSVLLHDVIKISWHPQVRGEWLPTLAAWTSSQCCRCLHKQVQKTKCVAHLHDEGEAGEQR